jgi:hypothetical protein
MTTVAGATAETIKTTAGRLRTSLVGRVKPFGQ